jgi:hypothetical protein
MGMTAAAVAADPSAWTDTPDSRRRPRLPQSSSTKQGRAGSKEKSNTEPTLVTGASWKSTDSLSTHDDENSSASSEPTDLESISTEVGQESEADAEHDEVGPEEVALAKASDYGFACEEELIGIGREALVAALSNVLTHLASLGARVHRATIFHAANAPEISIHDYLGRIAKYYYCSNGCLILGLIYIDRLLKMHPDFVVSSLNIHRLLSTSILLAAKFNDDVFYSNKYYGKVAGVRLSELNVLEEHFLQLLSWRMYVSPEEYDEYLGRVLLPTQVAQNTKAA